MEISLGRIILFDYPLGATPLESDEAEGLIPIHITTQSQLNEWEQYNIIEAEQWLRLRKRLTSDILTERFIRNLHQRMFNKTWSWAGKFRQSDKNIGVDWCYVPIELKKLVDDINYQIKESIYPLDELATKFHHRLVCVHPFANGNGRHSRLMTDILLLSQGRERFSWGNGNDLSAKSITREKYITSLRQADKGNYQMLLDFVRS